MSDIIYHYTSFETAVSYILPMKQLKLTRFCDSTDPIEVKERFIRYEKGGKHPIGQYIKYLSFCEDKENEEGFQHNRDSNPSEVVSDQKQKGSIFPRMWAQYGDNHKGVCLGFDKDLIISNLKKQYPIYNKGKLIYNLESFFPQKPHESHATVYTDDSEICLLQKLVIYDETSKYFFFAKQSGYSDENEFRLIVFDTQAASYLNFNEALKSITLGINTTKHQEKTVMRVLGAHEIKAMVYKLQTAYPIYSRKIHAILKSWKKFTQKIIKNFQSGSGKKKIAGIIYINFAGLKALYAQFVIITRDGINADI